MLNLDMQHTDPARESDQVDAASCPRSACCGVGWRFPLLLLLVLVVMIVVNGRGVRESTRVDGTKNVPPNVAGEVANSTSSDRAPPPLQSVGLTVDFGGGRRRTWSDLTWSDGLTVETVMSQAAATGEGIAFSRQGDGPSAFLSEMEGVANEGAGGKNWTYRVNGERADRGFGVYQLQPGDQVLWTFGE